MCTYKHLTMDVATYIRLWYIFGNALSDEIVSLFKVNGISVCAIKLHLEKQHLFTSFRIYCVHT